MPTPVADTDAALKAFSEGGAEAMRIDSSGNVGIGLSPSAKLDVYNSAALKATAPLALIVNLSVLLVTSRIR